MSRLYYYDLTCYSSNYYDLTCYSSNYYDLTCYSSNYYDLTCHSSNYYDLTCHNSNYYDLRWLLYCPLVSKLFSVAGLFKGKCSSNGTQNDIVGLHYSSPAESSYGNASDVWSYRSIALIVIARDKQFATARQMLYHCMYTGAKLT